MMMHGRRAHQENPVGALMLHSKKIKRRREAATGGGLWSQHAPQREKLEGDKNRNIGVKEYEF